MKITGPRSIITSLFTPTIYFQAFTFTSTFYLLCLILCKRQGRRNWQLLYTRWEQSYLLFAGPSKLHVRAISGAVATYLSILGVLRETNLGIFAEGTCRCTACHLPLGVTNEERDANLSCIKQFLAPLPGTQRRNKYASPDNSQSLAPLSDSCIQNRGVANFLLPLLFSVVSLPFSFLLSCL